MSIASVVIAFSLYSRVPMPTVSFTERNQRLVLAAFPLVGAVIAILLTGWLALCDTLALGAVMRGSVAALLPALVTGGIHLDGFMDTCDARGSWRDMQRRQEILKDSHVGAFAVISIVLYCLVLAGIFSELHAWDWPKIAAAFMLSRAGSAFNCLILPPMKEAGMLYSLTQVQSRKQTFAYLMVYLIAVTLLLMNTIPVLLSMIAVSLCFEFVFRKMVISDFGGINGDLAGYYLQVMELLLLAGTLIGGKV